MNPESSIYVAGHGGLVGSALCRGLVERGFENTIVRAHADLDLTEAEQVSQFFLAQRPEVVFLAAAKVGGILANDVQSAEFIRDNLLIQTHVIDAAWRHGAKKLVFLGSSCIYPKFASQPISEDALLTGLLEPTNEAYAVAKIAGIKMCQADRKQHGFDAISIMPTNLYGPGDNFDLNNSHVLPALLRKFHDAKRNGIDTVEIWGSGKPMREFLHVDDLADAAIHLANSYNKAEPINVGVGRDISIADLATLIAEIVGFDGSIRYDASKPDGTPRKLLNITRLTKTGWRAKISLRAGIEDTYKWFREHYQDQEPIRQ